MPSIWSTRFDFDVLQTDLPPFLPNPNSMYGSVLGGQVTTPYNWGEIVKFQIIIIVAGKSVTVHFSSFSF